MQKQLDSCVEEGVPYLIQDDVTCTHQYFEIHCSRNRLEPEKKAHARRTTRRAVLLSEVFLRARRSSSEILLGSLAVVQ
jgi:hypothetical protein